MNTQRRTVLKAASLIPLMLSAGFITVAEASEWNKAAFDAKSMSDVLKALGGDSAENNAGVVLTAPEIAENGAVVPVAISSTIAGTSMMAILVEKNPSALAASFTIPEGTEAFVSTRVKMGQTSNVIGLVKAGGKWYSTTKEVKVTLGGCGG